MPKVIHSFQLHISHQTRSYSCRYHLTIELYLFFWVDRYQGNSREKGPNTPKSSTKSQKEIDSAPRFTSNQTLPQCQVPLWVELYLVHRYSGIEAILENLGPNTPNHVQGHMKSNPKSLAPCFTSSETLLSCQDPLWVELYQFDMYPGIGAIW